MNRLISLISIVIVSLAAVSAQNVKPKESHKAADPWQAPNMGLSLPGDVKWVEGPATLRPGAKMAILEGDPSKEGFFTMRLWFPDGFEVMPHYHSQIEHVTVLSGTLNFGMGGKFDKSATRAMTAGSFGYWPIGMKHYAYVTGDTVLQLHGKGPWTVTYVNPADDPRKTK